MPDPTPGGTPGRHVDSIIAQVLGVPRTSLRDETSYRSIHQWDSLRHVELMLALEEQLGTEIGPDLVTELTSVGAIRAFAAGNRTTAGKTVAGSGQPVLQRGLSGVCWPIRSAVACGADLAPFLILEEVRRAMGAHLRHGIDVNVDFYAALVFSLLGIEQDQFTAVFATSRTSGWVAQALEQQRNNVLIRPLLAYAGEGARSYVPLAERHASIGRPTVAAA